MSVPASGSYEQVLYPGATYPQSHPERLATMARLFGLRPADVASCRVLELGCGSGENLLPLALQFPRSRFHGVDLSAAHVALANASIAALALDNLTIEQADIGALPGHLPTCDYVIAHGVYSWVPAPIRAALFEICRQHLDTQGVAYVSHNVNPGWRLSGVVREALLFHIEGVDDADERLEQARAMLDFMCAAIPAENTGYREIFTGVLARLDSDEQLRSYLFHDMLAPYNEPLYFTQFVAHARAHDLRFLAEADLPDMSPELLGEKAAGPLAAIGDDVVKREQYMDMLRNRCFRQTLLCHGDADPLAAPTAEALSELCIAFPPDRESRDDAGPSAGRFTVLDAMREPHAIDAPMVRTALAFAAKRWPHAVPFAELADASGTTDCDSGHAATTFEHDEQSLREELLALARLGAIELCTRSPPAVASVSERPRASRWVRFRIARGLPFCNLRNQPIEFADFTLRLIALLDGQHDHSALVEALLQVIAREDLAVCDAGRRLHGEAALRRVVSERVSRQLSLLAGHAMLES